MDGIRDESQFVFNAYDVFLNFLPGGLVIFGLWLPFADLDGGFPAVDLSILFVLAVVAFGIGMGTQAIGSALSAHRFDRLDLPSERTRPFNQRMDVLSVHYYESLSELDRDVSIADAEPPSRIEQQFLAACEDEFDLDAGYRNWTELFKSVLTYLENTPLNRGLRIQTLHLSARGLYVSFVFLAAYYLLVVGIYETTAVVGDYVSHPHLLLVLSVVAVLLAFLFKWRARHFEQDVMQYLMIEFCLATKHDPE